MRTVDTVYFYYMYIGRSTFIFFHSQTFKDCNTFIKSATSLIHNIYLRISPGYLHIEDTILNLAQNPEGVFIVFI